MDIDDVLRQIDIATEEEREKKIWERWIPYQSQMSFGEFKNQMVTVSDRKDGRTVDEIMVNVKNILTAFNDGR